MTNIVEDCPHRQQLEHTLLHCQTQTELLQATRQNYLSIIEEFQRDLEELTEQVEQQQQQQQQQQLQLNETTLQDMATDIEETATTTATTTTTPTRTDHNELQLQNELLLRQINGMQALVRDRDEQIRNFREAMTDLYETGQMRQEVCVLNQSNAELAEKVFDIAAVLKKEQIERHRLRTSYESLLKESEEQCKNLHVAQKGVTALKGRMEQIEKQQVDTANERDLLRAEIVALKENEAQYTGITRAQMQQLTQREMDVERARAVLEQTKECMKLEEAQFRATMSGLRHENEELRSQLCKASRQCKNMQLELKKHIHVKEQQDELIETFRQWKDAQLRAEDASYQYLRKSDAHVKMLLQENRQLCDEYKRFYNDYCELEMEMRRVKDDINSHLTGTGGYPQSERNLARGGHEFREDLSNRVTYIFETSKRLTQMCNTLKLDYFDLPRSSNPPPPSNPNDVPTRTKSALL